jgi:HNH endonuclease
MSELAVSVARVKEAFDYCPESGLVYWRIKRRGQANPGDVVGCTKNRYLTTKLDGNTLMVHRVAWAVVHGRWPIGDIDHIDGNPSNNRLANLRECSRSENMQNRRAAKSTSKSGFLGVWRLNRNLSRPWQAAVVIGRVQVWRERFETKDEAYAAYLAAKARLHPFQTLTSKV